jgi:hypothetical protein
MGLVEWEYIVAFRSNVADRAQRCVAHSFSFLSYELERKASGSKG